mmetsp:Transcript_125297/g.217177  ORF Transcript_125297/g.217177 Transcript_125297/m.217177 type:complete len:210 (+) Transcript_125297:1357-1986(+)
MVPPCADGLGPVRDQKCEEWVAPWPAVHGRHHPRQGHTGVWDPLHDHNPGVHQHPHGVPGHRAQQHARGPRGGGLALRGVLHARPGPAGPPRALVSADDQEPASEDAGHLRSGHLEGLLIHCRQLRPKRAQVRAGVTRQHSVRRHHAWTEELPLQWRRGGAGACDPGHEAHRHPPGLVRHCGHGTAAAGPLCRRAAPGWAHCTEEGAST